MRAEARLEKLSQDMLASFVRYNPVGATFLGLHEHDARMPDGTVRALKAELRETKGFLKRFARFPARALSHSQRIDREAALGTIRLGLFFQETLRTWQSLPEAAFTVGDALYLLFARDFAPFEQRLKSIEKRMLAIPRYLEESKERLTRPVKLWVETAIRSIATVPKLGEVILGAARANLPGADLGGLERAVQALGKAVEAHVKWLREDALPRAKAEYAIGPQRFAQLVRLRKLGLFPAQILAFGRRMLRKTKRELGSLAGKVKPGASIEETRAHLRSKHPATFAEALESAQRACREARDFVLKSGFANIPAGEALEVKETPEFMRPLIPFGAYLPPGRFDKKQTGIYFVTPIPDGSPAMAEHNFASLSNMSVHEAYPGHHLQLVCANTHPSIARAFAMGAEFCEG